MWRGYGPELGSVAFVRLLTPYKAPVRRLPYRASELFVAGGHSLADVSVIRPGREIGKNGGGTKFGCTHGLEPHHASAFSRRMCGRLPNWASELSVLGHKAIGGEVGRNGGGPSRGSGSACACMA